MNEKRLPTSKSRQPLFFEENTIAIEFFDILFHL